jgi:uncharacterized membrane protein
MDNLIRCKACGYVTQEGRVKDICPACGVPAKMFEPYTHPLSLKRRRILELHTHPVLVHFPQAFAITLLLLSLTAFFVQNSLQEMLFSTIKVLSCLLPFFLAVSIAAGLWDGKTRFRKISTPLLKKKIILSAIFFVTSAVMAALVLSAQLPASSTHMIFVLLALIIVLCGTLLGLIGGRLSDAKFPG